jgi:HSP20 family protein
MAVESKEEITVSHRPTSHISEADKMLKPSAFAPMEEVERLFDRLMPTSWMRPMAWNWPLWGNMEESLERTRIPRLDVVDRDKEILIRVELPGVDKKDISVSLNNSTLNITGCVHHELKEQKKDYVRCEIAHGNFSRSLAIPEGVDCSKIGASLRDGILEVTLPKEAATQRRAVEVK